MRLAISACLAVLSACPAFVSCIRHDPEDRKAVPPQSQYSNLPWNAEGPSGGGAMLNAMPQNRSRR